MRDAQRGQFNAAFVLHQRPYRDTSRIVEIFSAEFGRLALVARGVRGRRGPLASLLQPFRPLLMSWSGRGEMKTLNKAEAAGLPSQLEGVNLYCGFYANELMLRLIARHDPHPELFAVYQATLDMLSEGGDVSRPLRLFEKRLLDALGYGLSLAATHDGEQIRPKENYRYAIEKGAELVVSEEAGTYSGRGLISLASEALDDPDSLREARRLLRVALDYYLGDKPLKSRQIMYSMRP